MPTATAQVTVLVALDATGNGHDGIPLNATRALGKQNLSMVFNGVNASVRAANGGGLDDPLNAETITMWVNLTSAPASGNVRFLARPFSANTSLQTSLFTNPTRNLCGYFGRGGVITSTCSSSANATVPVGSWLFVALTYDGARQTVWFDGNPVTGTSYTGPLDATNKPLHFGSGAGGSEFAHVILDDVRIYNRALNDAELDLVANGTPYGLDPRDGLLARWTFDEVDGPGSVYVNVGVTTETTVGPFYVNQTVNVSFTDDAAIGLLDDTLEGPAPLTAYIVTRGAESIRTLSLDWNADGAYDLTVADRSLLVKRTWDAPGAYPWVVRATYADGTQGYAVGVTKVRSSYLKDPLTSGDAGLLEPGPGNRAPIHLTPGLLWDWIVALALLVVAALILYFRIAAGNG